MEFAERLKTLRKQVKLTQAQIAEKLNISQQAYASWERGVKKPTQDNLVKIAQILNVSVDYLVGNSEEKSDELDNIELLFRMNSKGLTDEEKEIFKKEDPQAVVIDEVLGFLTTLFLINPVGIKATLIAMGLAFIIFRILDITKIGPIYKSQSFGNGVGVVLDDFLAGIIGNFILVFIWTKFFY